MNAEMSDCLHAHGTSTIPFLDEPTVIIYINIKNENLPEFRERPTILSHDRHFFSNKSSSLFLN